MDPVVRAVATALPHQDGLAARVRCHLRGWNGRHADPYGPPAWR
ncbi:hypothetical protein AB0E25_34030 [Streptomyces bobili]